MTQNSCCVPGCLVTSKDGVPLHCFPNPDTDTVRFQTWISNVGLDVLQFDNDTICKKKRVCHKHFESIYHYTKNRLCRLATPILQMPGVPVHKFPNPDREPVKFKSWTSNIGGEITMLDDYYVYTNRRICHKHFEDIHKYPSNKLSKLAIPVLHMPALPQLGGPVPASLPEAILFEPAIPSTSEMILHKFPNPRTHLDQLKEWVEVTGGKLETDEDYKRYERMRICDVHFNPQHRNRNNRLSALAVPSLYLDGDLSKEPLSFFDPADSTSPAVSPAPAVSTAPAAFIEPTLVDTLVLSDDEENHETLENSSQDAEVTVAVMVDDDSRTTSPVLVNYGNPRKVTRPSTSKPFRAVMVAGDSRTTSHVLVKCGNRRKVTRPSTSKPFRAEIPEDIIADICDTRAPEPLTPVDIFTEKSNGIFEQMDRSNRRSNWVNRSSEAVMAEDDRTASRVLIKFWNRNKVRQSSSKPFRAAGQSSERFQQIHRSKTINNQANGSADVVIVEDDSGPTSPVLVKCGNQIKVTMPSMSKPFREDIPKDVIEEVCESPSQKALKTIITARQTSKTFQEIHHRAPTTLQSNEVSSQCMACRARAEHSYSKDVVKEKTEPTQFEAAAAPTKPSVVQDERLLTLRQNLQRAKLQIWKLKKRNKILKEKMDAMKTNYKSDIINKVTKDMTPAAKVFTKMQFTQAAKAPGGRRFTAEEKALSISLYNTNPPGYTVLANLFTLPSLPSIKKCLSEVTKEIKQYNEAANTEEEAGDEEMTSVSPTNEVGEVNAGVEIDLIDLQANSGGIEDGYQQKLSLAISGLSYDMLEL